LSRPRERCHRRARRLLALRTVLTAVLLSGLPAALALDPDLRISQYAHTARRLRDGTFPGTPTAITQTTDGYVWIGTLAGLLRFDGVRFVPWLGLLRGGLARYRNHQVQFSPFKDASARVNQVLANLDGSVLAATQHGLVELRGDNQHTLDSNNGLPCNRVFALVTDKHFNLWLYAECGLIKIKSDDLQRWRDHPDQKINFDWFDAYDGAQPYIPPFSPVATRSNDGRLWFANGTAAQMIDPDGLLRNPIPPPVHIEDVIADRKTYSPESGLRLRALTRDLEIDYTALSFVVPQKVHFQYKLEGYDRDWQDAGTRRQAFYSNLPPRRYTFRVKASNKSGVWNEAGASLDFFVAPAYYQTNWFRFVCLAACIALLWALHRWRVHRLTSQEKHLRDVVETIPAMTFTTLSNGSTTFVNKRWTEYTGLSVEQSSGTGWRRAIHSEDLARYAEKWYVSVATGQLFEDEARFRRAADREYRWFLVRGVPLRDRQGRIVRWYGTLTDIEDRQRAEVALQSISRDLQESKARLEEAQRITHVGYWERDLVTSRITWSDETYRIFGLQPQKHPMDLDALRQKVHPEDWEFVARALNEALAGGPRYNVEYRLLRPTGEIRVVHSEGDLKGDESGRPYRMFGTVQDITDRQRAEEALQQIQFYLAEGQRLAHIGSWAFNTAGFDYWSWELFQIHGLDPRGKPPTAEEYLTVVHPDDREFIKQEMAKMLADHRAFDFTKRIVCPDGEIRYVRWVGIPVTQGKVFQGFVGTGIDVTEQELLEQERERLRQLETELAHTNRVSMLGEMAASLAHEIKQPIAAAMTSANSCIEWLAHEPPNLDRARAAAAKIDKYGNRAAEIIDHIRSLYRKSPPQSELIDVNEIVHEIFSLLQGEAVRYSIAMRPELAGQLPKIKADHVQLQQVFMNLMLNAIEAMRDEGGELTVKSERQDGQLLFSVSDTGPGLPAGNVDQIFSAFFTTKPQGSGMGLAISRSIVESHGGRLWATANDGRGATFHFTLPTEVTKPRPLVT
jgi:PAS domain S-box-containing protein